MNIFPEDEGDDDNGSALDSDGEGHWSAGNPFILGDSIKYRHNLILAPHWSSTPDPNDSCKRYVAFLYNSEVGSLLPRDYDGSCAGRPEAYWAAFYWPVRDGD